MQTLHNTGFERLTCGFCSLLLARRFYVRKLLHLFFVTNWITAVLRADLKRLGLFGECYLEVFLPVWHVCGRLDESQSKAGLGRHHFGALVVQDVVCQIRPG